MKKRQIQIVMAKYIAAIVTCVLCILGGFDYYSESLRLNEEMLSDLDSIAGRLEVNLIAPLWDMNSEGALGVLESEMTNRSIFAANVIHKDALVAGVGRDESWGVARLEEPVGEGDYVQKSVSLFYERNGKQVELGELTVFMSKKFLNEALRRTLTDVIVRIVVLDVILVLAIVVLVRRLVVRSLQGMIAMLKDIAQGEGDLTRHLHDNSGTEIQDLAEWFNLFIDKIRELIREMISNASQLGSSANNLLGLASTLTAASESMTSQANAASSSLNAMSGNMNSVASAMEEFSVNLGTVATSSEEMSTTISEISENTSKAKIITGNAVNKANEASARVNELGAAAHEISQVTETITAISSQTNLLALNATIEAARAGEAGRGFAVVANEIKELALQTARATEEIRAKIQGIQNATGTTVTEIHQISEIVGDVDQIVSTIAAAVEEQSVSTRDIADNVGQASLGVQDVNENVANADSVIRDVADSVTRVSQTSCDISSMAGTVQENSEVLNGLAEGLNEQVGKFRV